MYIHIQKYYYKRTTDGGYTRIPFHELHDETSSDSESGAARRLKRRRRKRIMLTVNPQVT
jgi:hypothetical protein